MRLRFLLSSMSLIALVSTIVWLNRQPDSQAASMLKTVFKIGEYEFIPGQLFLGLGISVVLVVLARTLVNSLENRLRRNQRSSRAANIDATVTLSRYGLYMLALLLGIAAAGLDLTNLTIIVGALSVGIGFGLQNIVSNFISGIILLIEQPIRAGDFIQVGDIEGFVRRVGIRGTEVVTFDHSTVILPNSELISGTVTNWNLHDDYARISVTVGVAYGSDTRKVERLLLQCAYDNPLVISDAPDIVPKPGVAFIDFADSALMFKLVCYVEEAGKRFAITSELRYAIDDSFRRNGISIPFPQRDVHMRDTPADQGISGAIPAEAADDADVHPPE
jgi:small-conductance mechanosensitive channel